MADKKDESLVYFYDIPNVRKHWKWFFVVGILLIALGVLAIGYANMATEFTVIFLGFFLAAAGILQLVSGLYVVKWTGFSLSLLLGLFYVIAGCLCIFKPMQTALAISLLIAVLLLVGGFFRLLSALRYHFDNWRWVVFNGLIAIILGFLILAEWPASAVWVIGLFVGIDFLLTGYHWLRLSLIARK